MENVTQSEILMDTKDAIECTLHYLKTGDGPARYCVERLEATLFRLEHHEWPAEKQ